MLMDILGALIGFVSVILLLSLIVTALVQFVENVVHLRARNLKLGLEWLFKRRIQFDTRAKKTSDDDIGEIDKFGVVESGNGDSPVSDAKALANHIIELAGQRRPAPVNIVGRTVRQPVSWIESADLVIDLEDEKVMMSAENKERMRHEFERIGNYLSKRFTQQMRIVTLVCSIPVAIAFQVSTPKLLEDLSTNPALRSQAVVIAERLDEKIATTFDALPSYQDISNRALLRLQENHDDLSDYIEEAGGIGADQNDIVAELRKILCEKVPEQCEEVVAEYETILDELRNKAVEDAIRIALDASGMLAQLNITFWPSGWVFYKNFRNCIGVVITIVLMSFGAPFWFEALRNLLKLRDLMQPKKAEEKESRSR